jgi:hypothetical protein
LGCHKAFSEAYLSCFNHFTEAKAMLEYERRMPSQITAQEARRARKEAQRKIEASLPPELKSQAQLSCARAYTSFSVQCQNAHKESGALCQKFASRREVDVDPTTKGRCGAAREQTRSICEQAREAGKQDCEQAWVTVRAMVKKKEAGMTWIQQAREERPSSSAPARAASPDTSTSPADVPGSVSRYDGASQYEDEHEHEDDSEEEDYDERSQDPTVVGDPFDHPSLATTLPATDTSLPVAPLNQPSPDSVPQLHEDLRRAELATLAKLAQSQQKLKVAQRSGLETAEKRKEAAGAVLNLFALEGVSGAIETMLFQEP